jgi:hypothetical protein
MIFSQPEMLDDLRENVLLFKEVSNFQLPYQLIQQDLFILDISISIWFNQ